MTQHKCSNPLCALQKNLLSASSNEYSLHIVLMLFQCCQIWEVISVSWSECFMEQSLGSPSCSSFAPSQALLIFCSAFDWRLHFSILCFSFFQLWVSLLMLKTLFTAAYLLHFQLVPKASALIHISTDGNVNSFLVYLNFFIHGHVGQ